MRERGTPEAGDGPVVVIGASLTGLFAAAAAAEAGRAVTIVDRDEVSTAGAAPRPGVPQGRQNHVLLHRGLLAAEELVPGLEHALEDAGAVRLNTGELPWYGPFGWQPTSVRSYDVLSVTRPLLEQLVRERVLARPGVAVLEAVRVDGLRRSATGWAVHTADGRELAAEVVVDASGRGSRMPHWLGTLGCTVAEPDVLDASVGYASQLYRHPAGTPLRTGVVVAATPNHPRGALGLPVEGGYLLVSGAGYAADRPGRDGFADYLGSLRDPVVAEITAALEPVGDIAVHRQTGNRRHHYGDAADWPDGLLVVGDAFCAFNPIYGQGITVGACQALLLRDALRRRRSPVTRALQRRFGRVASLPWTVATTEDVRYLPDSVPGRAQRLLTAWSVELGLLVMAGNRRASQTFGAVYHLMAPPELLFHPALVAAVLRRRLRRSTAVTDQTPLGQRPAALAGLGAQPVH